MRAYSASPFQIPVSFWRNRSLLLSLIVREVAGRYRGSLIGVLWSFLLPIAMLMVYTFVFSVVFKARWSGGGDSKTEFALVLFAGLLVFNFFAECVNRAPGIILANVSYVKKVVFPLEILPWVIFGAAGFHALASLIVWLGFYLFVFGVPNLESLLLPVILIPFFLIIMGISWFLASLGVFVRDVSQIIGVLVTSMMFMSPIFYPVSAMPEQYQSYFMLNPLTPAIEMTRDVLVWGRQPDWHIFSTYMLVGAMVFLLGFAWFQKTRKGFADVI